ncbi:MAG: extracellular solute-binding protein [Eubacteriales bacterium]|nr:extracellular solute-binding protein [Eubacteriales bacterium]
MKSMDFNWRKGIAAAAAVCVAVGGLAGCGDSNKDEKKQETGGAGEDTGTDAKADPETKTDSDIPMGRYLEEDMNVPEGSQYVEGLTFLDDGSMGIIYRDEGYSPFLSKSKDQGQTWEKGSKIADMVGIDMEGYEISKAILAKNGGMLLSMYTEAGEGENIRPEYKYAYIDPEGESREIEIDDITAEDIMWRGKATDKGTFLLQFIGKGIIELNPDDGSVVNRYEESGSAQFFGAVGSRLIVVTYDGVHYYDLDSGKPLSDEEALTKQIMSESGNLSNQSSSSDSIIFAKGDQEDSIFYVDHTGIYGYTFGGNVVEQIVNGSLNSIGSPDCGLVDFIGGVDGSFYLLTSGSGQGNMKGQILKYVYSKDTPSVPDTELKIYSLKESDLMKQVAAVFQKKYPDIYLSLETGMTGEDAVTSTDAIKTLNTEIMAGKGPDILILDGIPEDTYVEKGMLEDLSGVLKDAGILENIKNAYVDENNSIYRMPAKFGIPFLCGNTGDVDKITDLNTLADVIEQNKEQYSADSLPMYNLVSPKLLLKSLADVCAPAWFKEDGTLDETAVKDYLEQSNRIYQAGKEAAEQWFGGVWMDGYEVGDDYQREYMSVGGTPLMDGSQLLNIGGLYSPDSLATLDSTEKEMGTLSSRLFNGQAENCFIPLQIVGISAKTENKEAAEKFVQFLFSGEAQMIGNGLPVNQSVYEDWDYWNVGDDEGKVSILSSSNGKTGEMVTLNVLQPSEETVKKIQDIGKTLTVPSAVNDIILNAVAEQGQAYLKGESTLEEAASSIIKEVNLYLSE